MYIVEASKFVSTASAKSVKKGAIVKVSGTLTNWNGSAWVPTPANGITLQRQVGKGKWSTIVTSPTDATGHIVLSATVKTTARYRLVYAPDLAKGIDGKVSNTLTVAAK
jgi:hypothetical protein